MVLEGNIVDTNATVDNRFFTKSSVDWSYDTSVPIPTENNEVLNVEKNIESPSRDILNMERSNHAVGAFNLGSSKIPKALKLELALVGTQYQIVLKNQILLMYILA